MDYRKTGIRERTMAYGSTQETDYVCTACLAVVPEPATGCRHCKKKQEKFQQRLTAFQEAQRLKREESQRLKREARRR
jgi:ribosomal protein L40E